MDFELDHLYSGSLAFQSGQPNLLEIGYDGARAGLHADFSPLSPLVFRW